MIAKHDNPTAVNPEGRTADEILVLPGYRVYQMRTKAEAERYAAKVREESGASCGIFLSPILPNVWMVEHFFGEPTPYQHY